MNTPDQDQLIALRPDDFPEIDNEPLSRALEIVGEKTGLTMRVDIHRHKRTLLPRKTTYCLHVQLGASTDADGLRQAIKQHLPHIEVEFAEVCRWQIVLFKVGKHAQTCASADVVINYLCGFLAGYGHCVNNGDEVEQWQNQEQLRTVTEGAATEDGTAEGGVAEEAHPIFVGEDAK